MRIRKLIDPTVVRRGRLGAVLLAVLLGGLLASAPTRGADSTGQVAGEPTTVPDLLMLCEGHPVPIVIKQKLVSSWGGFRVGQPVKARVASDVLDGSEVVIPEGVPVEVRIRHMRRGQMAHGRGQMLLEAVATQDIAGLRVFLEGGLYVEGRKHLVIDYIPTSVESILFGLVLGSGGSAVVAKGTTFFATVRGDHRVARPEFGNHTREGGRDSNPPVSH
jgi:hypothetical protein